MAELQDKTIIITGGSGEIGKEMARTFLDEGARVALVDLDEGALSEAKKELDAKDRVLTIKADVSSEEDTARYFAKVEEAFGGFDVLCANAGIEGEITALEELSLEDFQKVQRVNVDGVFLTIKHGAPKLADRDQGGSIIITSSVAGLSGSPGTMAYSTSKHATVGIMRVAAQEYGPRGVRVNSIHPGPVDNRMMRSIEDQMSPGEGEQVKKQYEQQIPLRRYAKEEDVANLALFLASDKSAYCHGGTFVVDGGMLSS